ncbi:MAG: hypothetical protein A2008_08715 [Candidatus Wallbacteria bacterium GWC2_49_35]|uniref:Uncharacterized protein n=1 Tax=Candidatus Wallbacteria bacterium GWC2_49_35 TaxID=1817813 RepID=A0A1F7WNY0_9BACT|nr:MAG: hypothetical protein A2008_08715 [Candidatus Wallbacteria bacterium GWC2_49_35]HBC75623.1 hypothetical protein [Candidatus Wallbacteria bacterium]
MKVLFLDPIHKVWEFFRGLTANPALIYLTAVARRDFNIKVYDAYGETSRPWNKTAEYLAKERPDVVCMPGSLPSFWYDVLNAGRLIREILPEAKIVTGGYISNQLWREGLSSGYLDYIVMGEGEITMMELLKSINSGASDMSQIEGLAYLKDGKPFLTAERAFIDDLDTLPMPAFDLFPMNRYSLAPFGGNIGFTANFSRGCVGRCKFCSETLLWRHCRRGHSAEYMLEVLSTLRYKYNKRVFYIGDDDFLHDPDRIEKFTELAIKTKLDVKMWIQTTCRNVVKHERLLAGLKKAGVYQVMVGIESPKPKALQVLNKPQDFDMVMRALETLKPHEFIIMGMMMWGTPFDTMQDLVDNLEFLNEHCDIIGPDAVTPWPGTPYYDECEKIGAIEVRDLTKYDMTNCITRTAELSAIEADYYYKKTVGKHLMFNKKFLGNYLFSKKPLYRTYVNMFVKMGWSFFTMKPWTQKNYQSFEEFFPEYLAKKASYQMQKTGVLTRTK